MNSRRDFLKGGLIAGVGLPLLTQATQALGQAPQVAAAGATSGTTGQLLMAGFGGKRNSSKRSACSVVTVLDVASGEHRQAWINMPNAHTLLPLAATGACEYLCLPLDGTLALFLDHDLREVAALTAPKGFLFSGHGALVGDQGKAFISLRLQDARRFTDHGRLGVVDVKSRQLLAAFDSGGVRPHDMAPIEGGKKLVVSHYGDINYEVAGKNHGNAREPRVVVLEPSTGRILQTIAAPATGSLTHIAAGEGGVVCGVPLNYYGLDEAGRRAVEADLGGQPFELSVAEELEGRIAAPMPIFLFDLNKGTTQVLAGDGKKQRRAQSVTYHPASGRFFITYTFSDVVACVDGSGVQHLSAFDLGLSFVRGLCPVGASELLAVTGEFRGLTLVNARTLQVAKRFDVPLYDSPHVLYRA